MAQESKISGGVVWILSVAAAVSFILGYLLAVVAGIFWPTNEAILAILAIMGLLVGFFNITGREIVPGSGHRSGADRHRESVAVSTPRKGE